MAVLESILFWLFSAFLGVLVFGTFVWMAVLLLQAIIKKTNGVPAASAASPPAATTPAARLSAVMAQVSDLAGQPVPAPAPPPPSVTDHHPALKQALMATLTDTVLNLPLALDRKASLLQEAGIFIEKLFAPAVATVPPAAPKT